MNNATELTAADLALYLGCEVYAEVPTASGTVHVRRGRFVGIRPAEKRRINPITVDIETESGGVIDMYFLPEQVKPILRPLSDMTEEEAREMWSKCYGEFDGGKCLLHLTATVDADERNDSEFDIILGYPDAWRYLLSQHFDLFGWIDAGLAIDKTKAVTP